MHFSFFNTQTVGEVAVVSERTDDGTRLSRSFVFT